MSATETCVNCGKKIRATSPGSITQWLFPSNDCVCNRKVFKPVEDFEFRQNPQVCLTCSKLKGPARTGTMTQWIFSSKRCSCDPYDQEQDKAAADAFRTKSTRAETSFAAQPAATKSVAEAPDLDPAYFPTFRYKPIKLLGQGGLGQVYLCFDELLSKNVAVKCLLSLADEHVLSFQNEARIACQFKHEALIPVLDFGVTSGGRPYMVMEYFEARSLHEVIEKQGPLAETHILELLFLICDALKYLHEHGVLHRDLKPSNILISTDSDCIEQESSQKSDESTGAMSIRLIDFGLAKSTYALQSKTVIQSRTIAGTPYYMSPEQVDGKQFDVRSEIYSLGCVLFETITGSPPFTGDSALVVLNQHVHAPVISPIEITSPLARSLFALAERCLEKQPESRFQSVDEIKRTISELSRELELSLHKETTEPTGSQRSVLGMATIFLAVGAIIIAAVFSTKMFSRLDHSTDQKQEHHLGDEKNSDVLIQPVNQTNESVASMQKHIDTGAQEVSLILWDDIDALKLKRTDGIVHLSLGYGDITEKGLSHLATAKLKLLAIIESKVTTLEPLARLSELRDLTLINCPIPDESFKYLTSLKKLHTLKITDINITDNILPYIAQLPELSQFDICNTGLHGKGLVNLAKLKHLGSLNLRRSKVEFKYVRQLLLASSSISSVNIHNCPAITAQQLKQLSQEFPKKTFYSSVARRN